MVACGWCGGHNSNDDGMNKNSSSGNKLLRCSRCKTTFYCNKECQKKHWKVHRKVCILEDSNATSASEASQPHKRKQLQQKKTKLERIQSKKKVGTLASTVEIHVGGMLSGTSEKKTTTTATVSKEIGEPTYG
eukprot:m.141296 g.141296  ORF g.141296 m.141296 type:complete len:133 (+) comp38269_c0_seq1:96-494(+)